MGIDYSASIAFGCRVTPEMIGQVFGVTLPEKFHMEDRFDPKTGKKLPQVKVIDWEEMNVYKIDKGADEYFEDQIELMEEVCKRARASYWIVSDYDAPPDETTFIVGVTPKKSGDDGESWGRVDTGPSYSLDDVADLRPELEEIRKRLKDMGLKIGPPRVYCAMYVC